MSLSASVTLGKFELSGEDAGNGLDPEDFALREIGGVTNLGCRTFEKVCSEDVSKEDFCAAGSLVGPGPVAKRVRVLSVRVFTASSIAICAPCCLIRSISSASALSLASIFKALERTRR
jgi:hypothetical protein